MQQKLKRLLLDLGLLPDPLAPHKVMNIRSRFLKRRVRIDVYLPPAYEDLEMKGVRYPLVVFNDGQDLRAMRFKAILRRLFLDKEIEPLIAVGIHAGARLREYGVMHHPDYLGRGDKAEEYAHFLAKEFYPRFSKSYRLDPVPGRHAIGGFSLGGLSAFDLAWNHPHLFGKVGVFSGALWWRSRPFREDDPDADRIVHHLVKMGEKRPGLQFWFMAGTEDEEADRNKNGVIDAIDDTLDLIAALQEAGYSKNDAVYEEVEGGRHEPKTWGRVMPRFLRWAFGANRPPEPAARTR
jgi:iron(III)-enterobactin esterase